MFWIIYATIAAAAVVDRANGFITLLLPLHRRYSLHSSPAQQLQAIPFDISDYLEPAKEMLLWEKIEENANRPVLDLSLRDLSLEEMSTAAASSEKNMVEFDIDEQQWAGTKELFIEVGILSENGEGHALLQQVLQSAPQLLRFDTQQINATVRYLLDEIRISPTLLVKESPNLMLYPLDDVQYGVEFLATMMMMSSDLVMLTCRSSPTLLITGVESGLQERSVQAALKSASDATSAATKRVAGDLKASMDELQKRKKKGL